MSAYVLPFTALSAEESFHKLEVHFGQNWFAWFQTAHVNIKHDPQSQPQLFSSQT